MRPLFRSTWLILSVFLRFSGKHFFAWLSVVAIGLGTCSRASAADDLAWPAITSEMRPWAWWWWHGSAVDKTNIAHELQRFHDAGLGGVQITSIFGTKGAESRDIPYLSPTWLEMLGYTVDEARRRGMGVDMTLGSGWCFGGPTVSDEDANASVVVKTFTVAGGESLKEKFNRDSTQALVAFLSDGKSIDLTDKISATGDVDWTAPAGSWTVYAISQKPSGQKVKRPAPGGEGWMLNPAYPQAMRNWLTWFDKAFSNYKGSKPHAVFQDSYEYRTDWSPDFFKQFEKLRGYKLQTELPALFGDQQDDHAARVKYDYRRTISDIMVEQSEPAWIDWAHKNGFATIYQAHGTPGNWLDLYAEADIPETEMFRNDRSVLVSKFASSAAHTQDRKFVGAETGTWVKEHFTETLADVKYLADDMFLSGVNHIYYHGACYSPDDAPWPGWLFYASTEMNPRNSIWHDVPTLNQYIARCQSILQSGKSDNDILLYWTVADFWSNPSGRLLPMSVSATDWFEGQPVGKTAHDLWNHGYSFDYVSHRQLLTAKVANGKIRVPGGDYQVVVVPPCKYILLESFKQLLALAESGATIVFKDALPSDISGANGLDERRAEFKNELSKIHFASTNGSGLAIAKTGKGTVLLAMPEAPLEPSVNVARESMVYRGLSFIRRSFDGGSTYFVANRTGTNFDGWVMLGRRAKSVAILDPMSGNSGVAMVQQKSGFDLPAVRLQLAAGESLILRSFAEKKVEGPAWKCSQSTGEPTEIAGNWNVTFVHGGPVIPVAFQTPKLGSWAVSGDTNAQNFAGTATYSLTFNTPDLAGHSCFLNLGDVRQSARIKLNGKDYGTLIIRPFRVVVDNLKPAGNKLEVEVTNVSANRIRDMDRRGVQWRIFKDINVVDTSYRPFDAANWPLADSGLLGPVTLTPVTSDANGI